MITRSLGKLFRGKATPFQIFSACILGSITSFLPAIFICPELYVIMFMLILILNTNLLIAAMTALPCKLLSMLLAPVSIQLGHAILDGSTGEILKPLINSPYFSWIGLEHYLVIGSIFFGLLIGIFFGIVSVSLVSTFRKKMAALDDDEEKFKKLRENKLFKFVTWVFFGSDKAKGEYDELLQKKIGNPIRIIGVIIFVLGLSTFLTISYMYKDDLLKNYITSSMEMANGATVEIEGISSDLFGGKISISHIAIADDKNLMKNKLELEEVSLDIDIASLLTKKFHVELISVGQIKIDTDRKIKATIIVPEKEPTNQTEEKESTSIDAKDQTEEGQIKVLETLNIEEYFDEYKEYYDDAKKLRTKANEYLNNKFVQKLIQKAKEAKQAKGNEGASITDIIRDQFNNFKGKYAYATHLVEKAPFILIKKIQADKVIFGNPKLKGTTIKINHLSSSPSQISKPIQIILENKTLEYKIEITLDKLMSFDQLNKFSLEMNNIDGEKLGKKIKIGSEHPLKKGNISITANAEFQFKLKLALKGNILIDDGLIDIKQLTNKALSSFEMPTIYGKKIDPKAISQIKLNNFSIAFTLDPFSNPPEYKMDLKKLSKDLTEKIKDDIKNRLKNAVKDARDQLLDHFGIDKNLFNKEHLGQEFEKQKVKVQEKVKEATETVKKEIKKTTETVTKEVKKEVKKNTDLAKKEGKKEIKKMLDGKKPEEAAKDILESFTKSNDKNKPKDLLKNIIKQDDKNDLKKEPKNFLKNLLKSDKKEDKKKEGAKESSKKKDSKETAKNLFKNFFKKNKKEKEAKEKEAKDKEKKKDKESKDEDDKKEDKKKEKKKKFNLKNLFD